MLQVPAANGVAGFMVSNDLFLFGRYDLILLFQSTDDTVNGILEVFHFHRLFAFAGSYQRSLVTYVGDVGAGKTGRLFSQLMYIHFFRDLDRLQVYFEYMFTAFQVGFVDRYLAVKTAGAQQRGIQHVGTVGSSQYDNAAFAA